MKSPTERSTSPLSSLPELVIFDCDGVLVDSETIANSVMARVLGDAGLPLTDAQCAARFVGMSMASVRASAEAELGRALPADFEQSVFRADTLAFETGLSAVTGIETALEQIFVPVCVASSGSPEKIANSLRITGLTHYFGSHIFSATMVANGKPAPDLFLLAAETMATAPARCVVIEDSVLGVTAGVRASIPVLGFAGASHACNDPRYKDNLIQAGAAVVFDDMTALPKLLGF